MSRPATRGIVGKTFGLLTVLEHVSATPAEQFYYRCRCACGAETKVRDSGHLVDGKRTSCGCQARQRPVEHRRPILNVAGERYGILTAKKHAPTVVANQGAYWLFKCDCGTALLARLKDVRAGNTASCGCLQAVGAKNDNGNYRFQQQIDIDRPWRKEEA